MYRSPVLATHAPRFIAVALCYFVAARLGVTFIFEPEGIAVFWPPAGLLLGYLLVTPRRHWAGAGIAAAVATVAANLIVGKSLGVSIGFAVVNALEPLVGAWLIGRLRPLPFRLHSARDLGVLFGAPAIVCLGAGVCGALVASFEAPGLFWSVWRLWWLADALGVILFAPVVVCWVDLQSTDLRRRSALWTTAEASGTFALLAAVAWGIFATPGGAKPVFLTLPYPVFPILLWVAIRYGGRGTALAVALVSLIAVWGSACGIGPVSNVPLAPVDRVLLIQGFCVVVSLSTFELTIAINERRRREVEIGALNASLQGSLAEKQAAAEEFRSQKQILETILDSMGEAVLVADTRGNVLLQNQAFRKLHDNTPARLPQESVSRTHGVHLPDGKTLCPQDDLPLFRAARGEACDNVELVVVNASHPEGLPINVTGRPLRGPTGITGAVITVRDVSATKRVEADLRSSERRYRQLVNGVKDYAIFLLDPTGRVSSWNDGAERIKGYAEGEILDRHFSVFYPAEDLAGGKAENVLSAAARTGQYEEEGWRVRKDGSRFWAHVVISAIHDGAGRLQGFAKATRDLTARRNAELALQRSEQRFRAIFDQTLQFIGLMAPDGTLLEANRTALAAAGIEETDVLGKPFWDSPWWTHDADLQARLKRAVVRAAQGETVRFEATHPAADGSTIWVDFSLKPYRVDGQVVYLIPEGRDVTRLKLIERDLRLAKEAAEEASRAKGDLLNRINAVVETAADGIITVHADGTVDTFNAAAARIFGYAPEEVLGRNVDVLLPDGVAGGDRRPGDGPREVEGRRKDGTLVPLDLSVSELTVEGRRMVTGIVRDITDRKRAEQAIAASEALLNQFVKHAPAAIAMLDTQMRYVRTSDRWLTDYHLGGREIVGRSHYEVFPDIPERWKEIHRRVLTGAVEACAEDPFPRETGETEWLQWEARPWHDAEGHIGGVIFFTQVITQRKRNEELLLASVREKEVMLREIHHRVKNNLAVISSLFGLQARSLKDEQVVQVLGEAQNRVQSMALVHEHLYNSADLGAVSFGEYARTLARQILQTHQLPDTRVDLSAAVVPVRLSVDQAIPCGLILNELLINCLKHAFRDRARGSVRLELSTGGGACALSVADDGVGVPADLDVRTTKSLGVRLVRTLARQLDGRVEYDSGPTGTRVRLTFPLAPESGPPPFTHQPAAAPDALAAAQ